MLLNYSEHFDKNVLDIFEEVTAVSRSDIKEYCLFKGIIKNEIRFNALPEKTSKKLVTLQTFNFNCKIKSYLHLLQLF